MAKFIQTIHDSINFHLAKQEAGYHSPTVIDRELNLESKKYFNELISEYAETRKISEHLQPLMVTGGNGDLTLTSGSVNLPTDFEHFIGLSLDDGVAVEILETSRWVERVNHPNKPPSVTYPIARILGGKLYVLPNTITDVNLDYFKSPTDCDYAFTTNVDQYVYNDASSVDWEWSKHVSERIVATVLRKFGISVRDQDIFSYSKSEEPVK